MALVDDVGQEFDYARKKAAQREGANLQAQKDALLRRQAQLGGGPSGAFIKAEQNASDASAQRLNDANEGIDTAQRGEMRRIREVQGGRDFARSEREASQVFATNERLGSQDWQSGEAGKQRTFATGEREASQTFATGEREASQTFATGEREASQTFVGKQQETEINARLELQKNEIAMAVNEGKLSREAAQKQLDELIRQYDIDSKKNDTTNAINTILSAHNSGLRPEVVGNLLSSLGIDVSGIPGLTEAPPAAQEQSGGKQLPAHLVWRPNSPTGYGWNPQTQRFERY